MDVLSFAQRFDDDLVIRFVELPSSAFPVLLLCLYFFSKICVIDEDKRKTRRDEMGGRLSVLKHDDETTI